MKSYFMAVKGYTGNRCRGLPTLLNIASWLIFATRFFISRFFRHDRQRFIDQSFANILTNHGKGMSSKDMPICVGTSEEIRLMRFFCRGEIRKYLYRVSRYREGNISVGFRFVRSISFALYYVMLKQKRFRIETFP